MRKVRRDNVLESGKCPGFGKHVCPPAAGGDSRLVAGAGGHNGRWNGKLRLRDDPRFLERTRAAAQGRNVIHPPGRKLPDC